MNNSDMNASSEEEVKPLIGDGSERSDLFKSFELLPSSATTSMSSQSSRVRSGNPCFSGRWQTSAGERCNMDKSTYTTVKSTSASSPPAFFGTPPQSGSKRTKYVSWGRWRWLLKRKPFLALLLIISLLLYINYTTKTEESDERIPVIHFSHVPGMKDGVSTSPAAEPVSAGTSLYRKKLLPIGNVHNTSAAGASKNSAHGATLHNHSIDNFKSDKADDIFSSSSSAHSLSFVPINISTTIAGVDDVADIDVSTLLPPPGYLVWSERCKMPNIDPYLPEVMSHFKREKYKPCLSTKPLTYVSFSVRSQRYVLYVDDNNVNSYTKSKSVDCCYQSIERNATGAKADEVVSLSECMSFYKSTKLASNIDNILVKCYAKKKLVYSNGHPMIAEHPDIRHRLDAWRRKDRKTKRRATSVLMIGIDSISRLNLIRGMPKTAQYLYDNEWFELSGYNKIDDNTFPNLMAVLTGRNKTNALHKCPPTELYGLDNCSFIWNTFREHGYVTAYGEDVASINTFNYLKVGFERPPVDYYLRPFLLAAEKHLTVKRKSSMVDCVGYKHAAEIIYDYALELATRYKSDPFFGLFWTNSFSHNDISDCTAMDGRMMEYLEKFSAIGTLENTIVIFFSDHGIRFGPTRKTQSGHMEERLPFIFLWLPPHLKQSHPEFVNALSINKNRLTNPYDLHMTLKHVLAMSERVKNRDLLGPAEDCPRCQTLLKPVPHNRSCDDVAIADHWCTCIPYQSVYKNSKIVLKLAEATVAYINDYVAHFSNGTFAKRCAPLSLKNVESAYRAQQFTANEHTNSSLETYRIIFQTKPNKALFEATVRYDSHSDTFRVTGEVSRLNSYASDSDCVGDGGAKKYCSCRKALF